MAFDESLNLFMDYGIENISKLVLGNTMLIKNYLYEIKLSPILLTDNEKKLSGIASFQSARSHDVINELEKEMISISVREEMLRISPHFYNTKDETDYLFKILKKSLN